MESYIQQESEYSKCKKQKYKLNLIYLIKNNCKRKLKKKTAKGAPCIDYQRGL